MLRWLEALPVEAKRRRPRLILQHALALALTGRPDDAELLSEEAERKVGATGEDRRFLSGFASAVGSWCARLRGDALHAVATQAKAEFEEEHGGEEGALSNVDSSKNGIPKGNIQNRVMELKQEALEAIPMYTPEYEQAREIKRSSFGAAPWEKGVKDDGDLFAELDVLYDYLRLMNAEARARKAYKEAADALDRTVLTKYPELTEEETKVLVVGDKWMSALERDVRAEIERVAQTVAGRVQALEERYAEPLPDLVAEVESLTERVEGHLREMGLTWPVRA